MMEPQTNNLTRSVHVKQKNVSTAATDQAQDGSQHNEKERKQTTKELQEQRTIDNKKGHSNQTRERQQRRESWHRVRTITNHLERGSKE